MGPIEVPVTAGLLEPRITEFKDINFGTIQIGKAEHADLHLINPTKEHVQLRLFLGYDLDDDLMRDDWDTNDERLDSYDYREIMERHIELYMAGTDGRTLEQIDLLFETFRARRYIPTREIFTYTTPHDSEESIVDILMRFSTEYEDATAQVFSDLMDDEDQNAKPDSKRAVAGYQALDDIFDYYQWLFQ